jgi:hypothetical protein
MVAVVTGVVPFPSDSFANSSSSMQSKQMMSLPSGASSRCLPTKTYMYWPLTFRADVVGVEREILKTTFH